jgi:hypothetical protein
MKHYRISIDVDIEARDREHAERRARCLYSDLAQRPWIVQVLPNGIEERIPIASPPPLPSPSCRSRDMTAATNPAGKQLPTDPDSLNDDRALWAEAALQSFMDGTGCDQEDALGDLLTDLMHWSDRNNYDFAAALERARGHYDAETGGKEAA